MRWWGHRKGVEQPTLGGLGGTDFGEEVVALVLPAVPGHPQDAPVGAQSESVGALRVDVQGGPS